MRELFIEGDYWVYIPEIFLFSVIMLLTVLGVYYNKAVLSGGTKVVELVLKLAVVGLVLTLVLYMGQWDLCVAGEVYGFNYQVQKDKLTILLISLVLVGASSCLLLSKSYVRWESIEDYEYVILLLVAVLGLIVILTANDLLVLYLGIELQSLCLYVLATFKRHSRFSTEGGLKYFVLGAVSSGILLFGMSLLYGFTGMTNLSDMRIFFELFEGSGQDNMVLLGVAFFLVGLLFKVGAAPFHVWLPDVYEGSPAFITSFFAIVPKVAIYGAIAKVLFLVEVSGSLFLYCGLLSLVIGTFGAIYQVTTKRLIAYSAIAHTGFILLAAYAGGDEALIVISIYLIIYVMMLLNVFGVILSVRKETEKDCDQTNNRLLGSFYEVYRSNRLLALFLCLSLFSMAGIPPLSGFFGKLAVLFSLLKNELFLVSIIVVVLSVVGAVYYIRLIRVLFFNMNRGNNFERGGYKPVSLENSLIIVYTGLFSLVFCWFSKTIWLWVFELTCY